MGRIYIDNEDVTSKEPKQRNLGMIFQQYNLFPTMNVFNNIAFGLKMKRTNKKLLHQKVTDAMEMVDLQGKEGSYPSQLSGGEQQRVALARCIVTTPKVLLLDEPFSAIDAKLRKALQIRIKEIHKKLGMTSIFVTHDQDEAMNLSDTIHLMNNGVIEQSGTPVDVYTTPRTVFAASFMGNYNIISAERFSFYTQNESVQQGAVVIRPEIVRMSSIPFSTRDANSYYLEGVITGRLPQGNILRYSITMADGFIFLVDVLFQKENLFDVGINTYLKIDHSDLLDYPKDI
jgi:putative spermidine/putrescine transport system ATP-binding protein